MKSLQKRRIVSLVAVIIALVMLFTLTACSKKEEEEAAPTTEPVAEPAPEPTTAETEPVPEEFKLVADCVLPIDQAEVTFDHSLTANGQSVDVFFFDWAVAGGNINDEEDPDRLFHAIGACVEELPFAMPEGSEFEDVTLATGIETFAPGTYVAVFLAELPHLSASELLELIVVPECSAYWVEYLGENNGRSNVCLVAVRFDIEEHIHDYISITQRNATCTEDGLIYHECACGDFYYTGPAALGHSWPAWSCDSGEHWRTCSRCGLQQSGAHTYGEWFVEGGARVYQCTTCGYKYRIIY